MHRLRGGGPALKLLVIGAVLVGGVLLADLGARTVAEDRIQSRLASSFEGERGLEIAIGGTFFVPQVLSGEFERIEVSADAIRRQGLALRDVEIGFRRVEVSLSNLMAGEGAVTVAGGLGSGVVSAGSLEVALRRSGADVDVELGDAVTLTTGGVSAEVQDVSLEGNTLTLTPTGIDPLSVELPSPPAGVGYAEARIEDGRLVLELDVPEGTLEL
ncbi:MAG TPA: DUF2993 domain-containing protein [Actinomycetota bacterium]|nr:DUF2993 domain-containing protein [Actinomycetota bacterium]